MNLAAALWRVLRAVLLALAAVVILVEEWGWRPLTAGLARLARWPPLARLEARIAALPPRLALALFLLPVLLLPVKLGALWLIGDGRAALGIALIVAAKLASTAFIGRLFVLVEPQLMAFPWFAQVVGGWRALRVRVAAALQASAAWRAARACRRAVRSWLRHVVH